MVLTTIIILRQHNKGRRILVMPSKNAMNKPKYTEALRHRNHIFSRKRNERERRGLINPPRSQKELNNGRIKSEAIDLYLKANNTKGNVVATKTLSKKREKKIERNMRYAEKRRLLATAQGKLDDDVDMDVTRGIDRKCPIKDMFWSALEVAQSTEDICQKGQGTTLGGPFYP